MGCHHFGRYSSHAESRANERAAEVQGHSASLPAAQIFCLEGTRLKTKKVHGVDLPAVFVRVRWRRKRPATWVLPIHVPGDRQKTVNLIKSAAYRVADTKAIPESERQKYF